MSVPGVDFELDTWRLVLFSRGPKADEIDEETTRELQAQHIKLAQRYRADGVLRLAGAITKPDPNLPVTGLGFFRTSAEETSALLDADPSQQAGLISTTIVEYVCPKGALPASPPPSPSPQLGI
jgi:uncharacterized protein YciI